MNAPQCKFCGDRHWGMCPDEALACLGHVPHHLVRRRKEEALRRDALKAHPLLMWTGKEKEQGK